jgi:hypothetical protein
MKSKITVRFLALIVPLAFAFNACGGDEEPQVESSTFTITNWQSTGQGWYTQISYSAISQDIIDRGAVLVYTEVATGVYNQVPLTFYSNSSYSTTIEVSTFVGGFNLFWTDSDLIQPSNPGTQRAKVVVIPAGPLEEWVHQNPEEFKDFKEASKALELKD